MVWCVVKRDIFMAWRLIKQEYVICLIKQEVRFDLVVLN